jgi:hypothetical protein
VTRKPSVFRRFRAPLSSHVCRLWGSGLLLLWFNDTIDGDSEESASVQFSMVLTTKSEP